MGGSVQSHPDLQIGFNKNEINFKNIFIIYVQKNNRDSKENLGRSMKGLKNMYILYLDPASHHLTMCPKKITKYTYEN